MRNLIDPSSQMKRRMSILLSSAVVLTFLVSPLQRSAAQSSRDRDQTGQRRAALTKVDALDVPLAGPNDLIYATSGTNLAQFSASSTGVVTSIPVTGLQAGEVLVGIDVRPANAQLYGIGSTSRLYLINPSTGAATQVGSAGSFTLNGTAFAVDFNPVPDRLRVISNTGQNLRIDPNTGNLAATDTSITPAGVTISGGAYDRNRPAQGTTTLYAIDSTNGVLTTVGSINGSPNSPNGGVVGPTLGSLGLGSGLDPRIGFDISGINGLGYATILTGGTDKLYSINLSTGQASLIGTIGNGTTVYSGMTLANIVTAGEVSIGGRVITSDGRGITNSRVTVSGNSLPEPITVVTGRRGQYLVEGLTAGETYIVTVAARRFAFDQPSRVITLNDNIAGFDFLGSGNIRGR